ncbi:hypothetical protein INR49_020182 [Caranx melampygus]|nr:hypothetical protein INR49_020182 [Caranx melampygus]
MEKFDSFYGTVPVQSPGGTRSGYGHGPKRNLPDTASIRGNVTEDDDEVYGLQAYSENQLLCTSTTTTTTTTTTSAHCRMIFISAACKEKCAQD